MTADGTAQSCAYAASGADWINSGITVCDRPWCGSERLTRVSYGDGRPYFRCPVGHVMPQPPPPDLHALDDLADSDD